MTVVGWQKPFRGTQLNRSHPLAGGLVGIWLFNEATGSLVHDLSGNANAGIITSPVWSAGGLETNRLSQHVTMSKQASDFVSDEFSLVWLGSFLDTKQAFFCGQYQPSGSGYDFGFYKDFGTGGINWYPKQSDPCHADSFVTALGVNYLIVGTHKPNDSVLYIDGQSVMTDNSATGSLASTQQFHCGNAWLNSYGPQTHVRMVALYNRALSADEVSLLHREPYCMFQPSFDIGAFEYISSGGGGLSIPVAMHHYNQLRSI